MVGNICDGGGGGGGGSSGLIQYRLSISIEDRLSGDSLTDAMFKVTYVGNATRLSSSSI